MADRVVILASSPKPDVYFNVITHNARQGVRKFVIAVVGAPNGNSAQARINLEQKFNEFVAALMDSHYIATRDGSAAVTTPLAKPSPMKRLLTEIDWGSLELTYRTLEESELRDFLVEQRRADAAFDVTACKNRVLAGAVAWLVSRGGSPIHSFEVSKSLGFAESDLLPYLNASDYSYPDLSSSRLIRSATRRVNAGTVHKKWFWVIAVGVALFVGGLTLWLPAEVATPIFAATATFATIMSAVGLVVRYPD
ncbi:hypothetical protein ACFXQA_11370 [Microbacterium sp. P07]|uniref:hypothetical protein n=1 Tax=Microbacterium sp. P07 TaxID=3366952 RepID=UPI003745F79B